MALSWFLSSSSFLKTYPELLLSAALFIVCYFYRKAHPSSVPPPNRHILGLIPSLLANRHRFHDWFTDLMRESNGTFHYFGPLSGKEYLLTADPANANHISNVNFHNYPKGHDFPDTFDFLGNGIFVSDADSWKSQRQKAHALMSSRQFRSFVVEASIGKVEKGLVPLLTLIAKQEEVVDFQDVMLRLTFDLTCYLVLGVDPGCLSVGFPTVGFSTAIDHAMEAVFNRHVVPLRWWKLLRFLGLGEEKKLARAREVIDEFITEIISNRRISKSTQPDLLTSYIVDADISQDADILLRDATLSLMVAGRDTTSAALTWFFWLLAKNPSVENRVVEELKECDFLSGSKMELGNLVYLQAALCETLRLYPPLPVETKRAVRSEELPSGVVVGPMTEIVLSLYAMGRMEGVWGKDCLEFKPERWISEEGKLRHEPSYKFLAFNSGPRTCLGKDIAFTQMKAVAAAVVYNFHVELVAGHVVQPKVSVILHMKNGLMVRLRKKANS